MAPSKSPVKVFDAPKVPIWRSRGAVIALVLLAAVISALFYLDVF